MKKRILLALAILNAASAEMKTVEVTLDGGKTGAEINPFIYGQFIEHLGRCIYGGIWAEMLEDRKFYFPVTADYAPYKDLQETEFPVVGASPWEITGPVAGVNMVRENVYVGEHAPWVQAGSGIRQHDLGVKAGMEYVGYLWIHPLGGPAEVEVALVWGEGSGGRAVERFRVTGEGFTRREFRLRAGAATDRATLEIRVLAGEVILGPPSLMPGDHINGMRRDTLALLRELNGTIYRWPGGNFVSGYNWRDGIGERDRRPPRKNPAWTGVEHNDFGTDEFIAFCRELGTEPMIAVNTGLGDAASAAQWVEYCNRPADTLAGSWRKQNGHPEPYGVRYWCVGNEMFGPWQLGFMQVKHYVIKHNEVAAAMWAVDPSAQLVGVGDLDGMNKDHDPDQVKSGKKWSQTMLENCAAGMNYLSEHFYRGRLPWTEEGQADPLLHVGMLRDSIRQKAEGHRILQAGLPNLKGRVVPIAMDEWNYWHREYIYGELGCVYDLLDGLGTAIGLHEYFRQSDLIQMAHYAQTVNVIGAIKTTRTAAEMETTGLALQLYRARFGSRPLRIEADLAPLDVVAALTADGKTLTLGAVNPTNEAVELRLNLKGLRLAGAATRWHLSGPEPGAHNTPGKPRVVDIRETPGKAAEDPLELPPMSCAVFHLPLK